MGGITIGVAANDLTPALVGVGGAAVVAGVAYYVGLACPGLPKGATGLMCIVIGIVFNWLIGSVFGTPLDKATVLGILSGLSAVGLLHGFATRERRNGSDGGN